MTRAAVEDVGAFLFAVTVIAVGGLTGWPVLICGLFIAALVIRDMRARLHASRPACSPPQAGRGQARVPVTGPGVRQLGRRTARASGSQLSVVAASSGEALLGASAAPVCPGPAPRSVGPGQTSTK